jgi:cytochrome P450
MTATVPPLFGPDMLADPYDMYARIRGPASWNEQMGLWLLTRYDDVRWALGEPRLSSTLGTPAQDLADESSHLLADMYTFVQSSLVFTDPPDHTRLRRLVIAAFVPSVINELVGPVSNITNRLLDDHVESLDLAAHLAEPMPIAVLGQLLGVSLSEAEGRRLKRWCDDFLLPFGRDIGTLSPDELARVRSAGEGLHGFVDTVLGRHDARGADDVVGRLLAGESEDRLSEQELFANIASELPWRGWKAASDYRPCSKGGRPSASRGVGVRRQLQRAAPALSSCRHILSATAKVCIQEIHSRREDLVASLQGMMTILMVRRVRATPVGLAPAGSVLG